jgi:cytochrome c-type biogenesis protein CcmH/NrfF
MKRRLWVEILRNAWLALWVVPVVVLVLTALGITYLIYGKQLAKDVADGIMRSIS